MKIVKHRLSEPALLSTLTHRNRQFLEPGMLIWYQGSSEPELVGDINTYGERCDDRCSEADDDYVIAYACIPLEELQIEDAS